MSKNPVISREGFIGLIEIARNEKNIDEVISLLSTMVKKFPADTAAQNDYNYFRLLAMRDVESATASAAELYNVNPLMMAFRITHSLALMRKEEHNEARKVLTINNLDWKELRNHRKAIKAASLIKSLQIIEAQELIDTIRIEDLFPQEQALITLPNG